MFYLNYVGYPVVSKIKRLKVCFAFQVLNPSDKVMIKIQSLQRLALGQALNHFDLIKGENQSVQVDQLLQVFDLLYSVAEQV